MTSLKEFDMHGLKYIDAQFEACRRMEEAYSEGLLGVHFIHGYKHGDALQNYVRKTSGLSKDLRRHCPELPAITVRPEGQGVTSALFEEETPPKINARDECYTSVNDNVLVILDAGWNRGCGSAVTGALAAGASL